MAQRMAKEGNYWQCVIPHNNPPYCKEGGPHVERCGYLRNARIALTHIRKDQDATS